MRGRGRLPRATLVLFLLAITPLVPGAFASGKYRVLHNFNCADGCGPSASLILDTQGNLYGTTYGGGPDSGVGTVFELAPSDSGQWNETVLHSFHQSDGSSPVSSLALGAGNLYGTATNGGTHNAGTAFELAPRPSGWEFSVLYNFCSQPGCSDGGAPWAGMVLDKNGNLYGTTFGGGDESGGVAFGLRPGEGGWTESVLYAFGSQAGDGGHVIDALAWDSAGNLYGSAETGGIPACSCGTVFKLKPGRGETWKEHVLYRFRGLDNGHHDGNGPSGVVFDAAGNLYGSTEGGGSSKCIGGCGVVFELMPTAKGWKETVLHKFSPGKNGSFAGTPLAFDQAGNLYGTAGGGIGQCSGGCGVVYKLTPKADGKWTYSVVHHFKGPDGAAPAAGVIFDRQGNLYGTTTLGGKGGAGVVFEITP